MTTQRPLQTTRLCASARVGAAWFGFAVPVSHALIAGVLLGAIAAVPRTCSAATGPAEQYIEAQLRVVRSLDAKREAIAEIAAEAAQRLLAGGTIYLAGERGMIAELTGRAGGLCSTQIP